jgi:hypothetical protein
MAWDNHGTYWEIDHIVPLAFVDLSKEEELKEVCHYTNLQPLTKTEHAVKSNLDRLLKD